MMHLQFRRFLPTIRRACAVATLLLAPLASAAAQDLPRVRVTRDDTTIRAMRYNRNDIWLLTRANAGAEFDVLAVDGDDSRFNEANYYLVVLPRDPWGTQWVGWVSGRNVESAPPRERAASAASTEPMMVTYGRPRATPAPAAPVARTADVRPATAPERESIPEVVLHFAFDRSELTEAAKTTLQTSVAQLKSDEAGFSFSLGGHADSTGADTYNQRLGLARAEAVRKYIIDELKIPEDRITVASFGESQPVAPNDTRDGRAENRRVVIEVTAVPRIVSN